MGVTDDSNECMCTETQNWDVNQGTTFIRLSGTEWCVDVGTREYGKEGE